MGRVNCIVFVVIACVGCGGTARYGRGGNIPERVNISVVGATIAPCAQDGTQWDGFGSASASIVEGLATALASGTPYAAVVGFLAEPAVSALARPEPHGWAEIYTGQQFEQRLPLRTGDRDTFTPSFSVTWPNVHFDSALRVHVHLQDGDILSDDPMGDLEIGYEPLLDALTSDRVHHVAVEDQTNRQVLFLAISVTPIVEH